MNAMESKLIHLGTLSTVGTVSEAWRRACRWVVPVKRLDVAGDSLTRWHGILMITLAWRLGDMRRRLATGLITAVRTKGGIERRVTSLQMSDGSRGEERVGGGSCMRGVQPGAGSVPRAIDDL